LKQRVDITSLCIGAGDGEGDWGHCPRPA